MKHWLIAGLIAGSWSCAAMAADLGPYRPAPYEPEYYEPARDVPLIWHGLYIGANAGYGWSNADAVALSGPGTGGAFGSLDADGWLGGGQIGANVQFDRLVLGVEADIQAADIGDSTRGFAAGGFDTRASLDVDWFFTLRGRIGYAAGPTLIYFTGGFAFADVDYAVTTSNGPTTVAMSSDGVKTGYTLGGGLEWAFAPNWSLKSEYLYLDLGEETVTSTGPAGTFSSSMDVDFHTVRLGLNYRF